MYIPSLEVFCQSFLVQRREKGPVPRYTPQHYYEKEDKLRQIIMLHYDVKNIHFSFDEMVARSVNVASGFVRRLAFLFLPRSYASIFLYYTFFMTIIIKSELFYTDIATV